MSILNCYWITSFRVIFGRISVLTNGHYVLLRLSTCPRYLEDYPVCGPCATLRGFDVPQPPPFLLVTCVSAKDVFFQCLQGT